MEEKQAIQRVMESVDEQLASVAAVRGEKFEQAVRLNLCALSAAKLLAALRAMIDAAAAGKPVPGPMADGCVHEVLRSIGSVLSMAADLSEIPAADAKSAMEWAERLNKNAQTSFDAMVRR